MDFPTAPAPKIVFFDGFCHLCNGLVDQLISRDPQHKLQFAPLQGETARRLLTLAQIEGGSVIFWDQGRIFSHSAALISALSQLGPAYRFIRILLLIPRFFRDLIYNGIARNRYKLFGQRAICRLPKNHERQFLLP